MTTITIPAEYAFVGAALVGVACLNIWQSEMVAKARKLAKIDYPQMYAEKTEAAASPTALKFNCAQRAHQNTLEIAPTLLTNAAFLGLAHPRIAAGSIAVWILGRIAFTIGYSTGNPKRRIFGAAVSAPPVLVVIIGAAGVAFQSIKTLL